MQKNLLTLGLALAALAVAFWWYRSRQPSVGTGALAPDFAFTTPAGQSFHLADLRGKLVLLHFWGSWCGPCRAENPYLVRLYQKYQAQGFDIVSIGVEENEVAWARAREKDGMLWPHQTVETPSFGGTIATLYNIRSIPATFLLNKEGRVLGVNLSPEQLDKMVGEQLGQ